MSTLSRLMRWFEHRANITHTHDCSACKPVVDAAVAERDAAMRESVEREEREKQAAPVNRTVESICKAFAEGPIDDFDIKPAEQTTGHTIYQLKILWNGVPVVATWYETKGVDDVPFNIVAIGKRAFPGGWWCELPVNKIVSAAQKRSATLIEDTLRELDATYSPGAE